jgi:hypothetical protein
MLYKDRVEKGLEHVKAHLLLHSEGTAEPPTPSLPPPSRVDTPTIHSHLSRIWAVGYAGMPSTTDERESMQDTLKDIRAYPLTTLYPYITAESAE